MGVFDPGEQENRDRSSQSPTGRFARRVQRRLPFLQDISLEMKKKLQNQFRICIVSQLHPRIWPIFRIIACGTDFEKTTVY